MNGKKSTRVRRGAGKGSSKGLQREVASLFSRLARVPDDKPLRGASTPPKPSPIGHWRVGRAERRLANFNRRTEA